MLSVPRAFVIALAAPILWGAAASTSVAQPPLRYDGIAAGLEAYERHEAVRRGRVGRQVELKESAPYRQWQPSPWASYHHYIGDSYWFDRSLTPWDFRYDEVAPQPIGHESVQVDENRWEYRPIYPRPPLMAASPIVEQPIAEPEFVEPEFVEPEFVEPLPPRAEDEYSGPREF